MFRRISTKITLVFAGLFAGTMLLICFATYLLVTSNAKQQIQAEMTASSEVFSRLFLQHARDTQSNAALLGKDFGFRAAVLSGDGPTISSALQTMAERLDVTSVAFLDLTGEVIGETGQPLPTKRLGADILNSNDVFGLSSEIGVLFADGMPFVAGAAPVYAPDLVGWIFFGDAITRQTFDDLSALAPLSLEARVVQTNRDMDNEEVAISFAKDILLTKSISAFFKGERVALGLSYPMAEAVRPYKVLLAIFVALIVFGCLLVCIASWLLARRLAQPISALSVAARRIRDGGSAYVELQTKDEIADLATSFNDMSAEITRREVALQAQARTDKETGLPNRFAFEEGLSGECADTEQSCVLVIGVERFAEIRNAIGFDVSSDLTRTIGERLQRIENVAAIAHLSDGVFAANVRAAQQSGACEVIALITRDLEQTYDVGGTSIDVMFKVGVSYFSGQSGALEEAMIALDQARNNYDPVTFFNAGLYKTATANLSLMGNLMAALNSGHVSVAYQPKYDMRTQRPVGAEALVRWNDPARGPVFPDVFIPLAEETGRIDALSRFVLDQAIEAQREMWEAGYHLTMSVNVSGRLIGNAAFSDFAIKAARRAAGPLCFEITETAVIEDPDQGIAAITHFVNAGIEISIDDYGSGLSSLAYLKRIPANELKIDKEFVLKIDESQRDALVVRSTIDLAHSLGMKVTAEGVETAAAASLLAGMGCDIGQGYGLGRPVPLPDFLKHLAAEDAVLQNPGFTPVKRPQIKGS